MLPDAFWLPSFAKINWTLRIVGKRDDGFHNICTLFQTVSLRDMILFVRSDRFALMCDDASIPTGDENLIMRAATALRSKYGVKGGAVIRLEKHIPSPGGLGGGSSNAATALIGLTQLWGIKPKLEELSEIAAEIGSDVPFFLHGGTAIGTGRGEMIEPVADINEKFMIVVTPDVQVSTAAAFRRIDLANLTKPAPESIFGDCRFMAESNDLRSKALINDFEASLFSAEPEIARVKRTLLELGALNAAMSGSGASVFAIFDKKETRQAALKALGKEPNWRKFAVATISRDQYREAHEI